MYKLLDKVANMNAEKTPLILLVDDNPTNLDTLVHTLRNEYRLGIAKSGAKALEYVNTYLPDLILLDIIMPGMDGFEVCKKLKSSSKTRGIPVIFITAMGETEYKTKGFAVGALDYITKPFHAEEVKARVRTHLTLKKAREHEINIASKIQRTLLLDQPPADIPEVEIAQLSVASQKVDGDFIDFFKQSETCFDLVVGDVMGKGIPAALLGAAMKSHLLRTINEMLLAPGHNGRPDIGSIISGVHYRMINQLAALETFVTLFYARFDLGSRYIHFVDCGHMPTIHYHEHSCSCTLLKGEDRPLGLPTRNGFESKRQDFLPGDVFVFYSDGLTEAKNAERTMYGETNLVEQVKKHADLAPQEFLNILWKDIVCFSESDTFVDDVTCVVVKILE